MQSRDINTVANNKSSTLKIVDRCFIDYFARRHKVTHPDGKPKAKMGFKSTNFLGIRQRIVKNQGLKSRQVSWMPDLTLALVLLLSEFESWLSLRFLTAIEYFRALRFLIHFEICKFASRIGSDLLERPEDNILRSRQAPRMKNLHRQNQSDRSKFKFSFATWFGRRKNGVQSNGRVRRKSADAIGRDNNKATQKWRNYANSIADLRKKIWRKYLRCFCLYWILNRTPIAMQRVIEKRNTQS